MNVVQDKVEKMLTEDTRVVRDVTFNYLFRDVDMLNMTEDDEWNFQSEILYDPIAQLFEYVTEYSEKIEELFQIMFPTEEAINELLREMNVLSHELQSGITYILRDNKIYHTAYFRFLKEPYYEKEMTNRDILVVYLEKLYTNQILDLANAYLEERFHSILK
jgi:hypothetical protein